MKYHLFAGDWYYPRQGLGDYVGAFETAEEAIAEGKRRCIPPAGRPYSKDDWYEVITANENGDLISVT